jgi:outer membrane receptor protein involved in Fe transport
MALAASLVANEAYAQANAENPTEKAATLAQNESATTNAEAAAEPQLNPTNDIVVTASKTGAQSLQKVPLAIQAFTGEELKQRNINSVDDLVSAVPGAFEGQRQSVASRSYNLRGAGGSNANGDSPIGYYLDDVPFVVTNFGIAPPVRFIDIDRVEVLRGPQGTLYGQGSSGGVFIFHTRDPDLEKFEFVGEVETSKTKGAGGLNYGFSGAVSIPLVKDMLALRVSGGHSYNPGWADEYYGPYDGTPDEKNVNVVRNDDIRALLMFKPAHNVTLRGQYWHFRPRQQFLGGLASVDPPYYQNTAAQPSYGNGDFTLYSLTATVDFDKFTITSATGNLKGNFGIYVPISPKGYFSSQFYPKMFSEELRVNSTGSGAFHWLIGAAYQDGSGPQANQLEIPPVVSTNADNNTITRNEAVFGQISYDLFGGKLVPLAGLRYYHDKRTFEDSSTRNTDETSVWTWRANLSYLPNDDLTIFVSAATGFRAGIVQSKIQADLLQQEGIPAGTQLKPETSTNYEIGVKWRTPDHNLNVDLNGYITKFKDLQTSTPTVDPNVSGFSNFGDATTKGIDFSIQWHTPIEGLALSAVGNINDGNFDRVDPAVQLALPYLRPGTRIVNTIEHNWRLDASYNHSIGGDWDGFFNVAWSHSGDRLQTSGQYSNPYSLFSATFGVRNGPYELAVLGSNLANEVGPTIASNNNPNGGARPTPRTIGLRFRANFQ